MGVADESAVTVADVSNSGVVPGGRFFGGTREKAMAVVLVVIGGGGVSSESREARQLVEGVLYMPLLGDPVPVRTGDVSGIPHSSSHDQPQFFVGDLVDGGLDSLFILV